MHTYTHAYIQTYVHTCVHIMYTNSNALHVLMHTHTYIVHTHISIHTHTHTHTHTHRWTSSTRPCTWSPWSPSTALSSRQPMPKTVISSPRRGCVVPSACLRWSCRDSRPSSSTTSRYGSGSCEDHMTWVGRIFVHVC